LIDGETDIFQSLYAVGVGFVEICNSELHNVALRSLMFRLNC
jgi:hypothetical protein